MLIPRIILLFAWLTASAAHAELPAGPESTLPQVHTGPLLLLDDAARELTRREFTRALLGGQITTTIEPPIDLGTRSARAWFGFSIHNTSDRPQPLQLETRASYRPLLRIHLVSGNGEARLILDESHERSFGQRQGRSRFVVSEPFSLPPRSSAWLVAEYESIGFSLLPLRLTSPARLAEWQATDRHASAWFYAFSLAALLLFGLFGFAMSDRVIVHYALLFLLGLFNIASQEGIAFQFLWPDLPLWNHYSSLVSAWLLVALGFRVARTSVDPARIAGWYGRILDGLTIIGLLTVPFTVIGDFVLMATLVNGLLPLMFLAHVVTMSSWITLDRRPNRLALVSAVLVTLVVIGLTLLAQTPGTLPDWIYLHANRLLFLFMMLATISLLSSHVRSLQRNHEHSLQQALQAAEREAQINRALYEAEQNYARAQQLAALRREQLASASHDMKQPLVSLRATLDALMREQPESTRQQLANAFDYLDNLCNHYLAETRPSTSSGLGENTATEARVINDAPAVGAESFAAGLILETTRQMFRDEAAARGIALRCVDCTANAAGTPMVVMRIFSNLVSNAVKHTRDGPILIGARRRPDWVELQVHDRGVGMSPAQLESVMQAYQKGPDSEGSGLGLAICRQLAEQNGLGFEIRSQPGIGTSCCLRVPRASTDP